VAAHFTDPVVNNAIVATPEVVIAMPIGRSRRSVCPGLRGIHPSWTNGAVDPLTDGRRTAGIGGRHYPPEAVALRDGPSALTLSPGVCGTSIRRASPGWTE